MNSLNYFNVKSCTYYFLDDMINIKKHDSNKIMLDEKPYKNVLIYLIGYLTVKNINSFVN